MTLKNVILAYQVSVKDLCLENMAEDNVIQVKIAITKEFVKKVIQEVVYVSADLIEQGLIVKNVTLVILIAVLLTVLFLT